MNNNNPNAICWFEIYVDDMARAKKFYKDVLHTTFQDMAPPDNGSDLEMASFEADMEKGVSGALVKMVGMERLPNGTPSTIVYFPCNDCSVEESRVAAAGGEVIKSKFSIGEYGFCSLCIDTEGNTFGLYSM